MTTKTIPEYLEDERRKRSDDQLRIGEEAARIQPLHHGHHRTAKKPKVELPSPVKPQARGERPPQQLGKSNVSRERRQPKSEDGVTRKAALTGRTWHAL